MQTTSLAVRKGRHSLVADVSGQEWLALRTRLLSIAAGIFRYPEPHHPRLDLDGIPDSMKRDLGFLDGRTPHYEDNRLQ